MKDDDDILPAFESVLGLPPRQKVRRIPLTEAVSRTRAKFGSDPQLATDISELIQAGYVEAGLAEDGRVVYRNTDSGRAWADRGRRDQQLRTLMNGIEAGLI